MQTAENSGGASAPSFIDKKAQAKERMAKARAARKPSAAIKIANPVVVKPAIDREIICLKRDLAKNHGKAEFSRTKMPVQCHLHNYSITGQDFTPETVPVALMSGKTGTKEVPCDLQGIFFDGSDIENNNFTKADCRWVSWKGCDPVKLQNNIWDGTDFRGGITSSGQIIGQGNTPKPWE